jgi:hypothetical protein
VGMPAGRGRGTAWRGAIRASILCYVMLV